MEEDQEEHFPEEPAQKPPPPPVKVSTSPPHHNDLSNPHNLKKKSELEGTNKQTVAEASAADQEADVKSDASKPRKKKFERGPCVGAYYPNYGFK